MEIDLTDDLGIRHRPTTAPARIVSLVPSLTELLFDLRLEDQIVGRTSFCIYPGNRVTRVPVVGGTKKVDLGKLRALEPTHVILNIDENTKLLFDEISKFVPTVIVTHPNRPLDNLRLFRLLGGIFHRTREAENLQQQFESAYASLLQTSQQLQDRNVLYLVWKEPWMTVSRETYISRFLNLIGWCTVPAESISRYPEIKISSQLLKDTEMILFSSEPYSFKKRDLQTFKDLFQCEHIPLRLIDGAMTSWYGSRSIKGLRYLQDLARVDLIPTI